MSIADGRFRLQKTSEYRNASVVLLLANDPNGILLYFIKRVARDRDKHSGQIAFPGGKSDDTDVSLKMTAQRELHEELGVEPSQYQTIGELTPLLVPVSKFHIHPYIFYANQPLRIVPQVEEVDLYFSEYLTGITQLKIQRKRITTAHGFTIPDAPYFDIKGYTVWGATAMILSEFKDLLLDV